jgi:hypothetical protein
MREVRWLFVAVAFVLQSCAGAPKQQPQVETVSSSRVTGESHPISDEMIGRPKGTMLLSQTAANASYGYSQHSPVMIGGGFGSGSERTYKFLNSLRGPNGETITYDRVGTCCPFKSKNSPFGDEALLEVYEIVAPGFQQPKRLYFNWYDEGVALIPMGLSAVP